MYSANTMSLSSNVISHRRAEGGAAFTKREYYATNDAIV